MKSKLILSIVTLAALALPAVAAENNFHDRDGDRDRKTVEVCGVDTCMRVMDRDQYRNHSILVDRDNLNRVERLRRDRFDRDRDRDRRDRDDVRR
jgi:hypothetical protein